MKTKGMPVSVRLGAAEAAFLADLHIPEATTPSEKIRALIREAQQRRKGILDYADGLRFQEAQMSPVVLSLRNAENVADRHSELVIQIAHWLPEALAYFQAYVPTSALEDKDEVAAQLDRLESGVADRVVNLMESILRLGITPHNPCYTSDQISGRLQIVLELCDLIMSKEQQSRR